MVSAPMVKNRNGGVMSLIGSISLEKLVYQKLETHFRFINAGTCFLI